MPRPAKSGESRRDFRLNLRLTAAEREQVERAATSAGIGVSVYAREQVLRGRVVTSPSRSLSPRSFVQIVRIGTNINQIARHLNSGGKDIPPELESLCARIESILQREV